MLDKTFTPNAIETNLYQQWNDADVFACEMTRHGHSKKPAFTMMMPPPNVTGALHIGHALNSTIQDVLARFKRHLGFDVLWQPGIDHAGIATQFVVERQLKEEGLSRKEMGREAFLKRVWEWKEKSGDTIFNQMKRLGISPDWKRTRFTMDDGLSHAVRKIFVDLYNDGLIYKDNRLVNWDPSFGSAISDLEVFNREEKGKLYHITYALEGDTTTHIIIATTRPETLFGDTAVAVNPEDERYQHLIGKKLHLPLTDRLISIIADEHCDKDFGTGALKVTPAHDFNDFEIGKRHNLDVMNILHPDGSLNDNVPKAFQGLKGKDARKTVVDALEACGALVNVEDYTHSVPYSEKSDARVEPYLTEQWFVKMDNIAARALSAVEKGDTTFFPKQWENTYFEWLKNIQPWCISRQIWWGHQIPAWYGPDGHTFVAMTEEEATEKASIHYGHPVTLTQDEDVLDTWFSSALWPFSTLGWPEKTPELDHYYPTSVLVTGFDIIFFWVARMMMMGLYTQNQIPFEKIYIHALVRDEKGQKMSKTRGNVLDPLDLIKDFGADALRFTLAISAAPGRDIKIGKAKVEQYRNFLTKIWNAARFLMMQEGWENTTLDGFNPADTTLSLSHWILSKLGDVHHTVTQSLNEFRFDLAAQSLYHFIWGTYCDFFLEFMKPLMGDLMEGEDASARTEILNVARFVFQQILLMMEPFAPFLTQHLFENVVNQKTFLCAEPWAKIDLPKMFKNGAHTIDHLQSLITETRALRSMYRVPAGSFIEISQSSATPLDDLSTILLKRMARVSNITTSAEPSGDILLTINNIPYKLSLGESVDLSLERRRIQEEVTALEKDLSSWNARFNNPEFRAKAKDNIVEELETRIIAAEADIAQKRSFLV